MREAFLDADIVYEQYTPPDLPDIQQQVVSAGGGGGGGTAIVDITSSTTSVTSPTPDTRNIELPQTLGPGASPTFVDITATGDLNAGDDLTVTDLATVGRLAVGGGTTIKKIQAGTVAADPGSIAAQTRGSVDVTITGVATGDIVLMNPPNGLNAGLVYGGCRVTAANTVRLYLANLTAVAIDDGSNTYDYLWIDFT